MDPSALRYPYSEINSCVDARGLSLWCFWLRIPISMDFSFSRLCFIPQLLAAFIFVLMSFAADRLALGIFHVLLCFSVKVFSFLQLRA
jgi:hypothetical protein